MSNSLSSRSAVIIDRASWGRDFGLMPRKSLVTGGPHCARPDAVKAVQPGSSVESNMSPSMACGAVMASFTVEDFSLNRLTRLDRREIDQRYAEFEDLIRLDRA